MGNQKKLSKHIHQHYYKHFDKPSHGKGSYVFPREIIGSSDWLAFLWKQIDRITSIPTTIIWGMKDIAFKEKELERWKNAFPNAEVSHWKM